MRVARDAERRGGPRLAVHLVGDARLLRSPDLVAQVHNAVLRAQLVLCALDFHPTPRPRARKAEVFGREKHGFFSARLRTPFRENAPVKFYFPLQTTFHAAKN